MVHFGKPMIRVKNLSINIANSFKFYNFLAIFWNNISHLIYAFMVMRELYIMNERVLYFFGCSMGWVRVNAIWSNFAYNFTLVNYEKCSPTMATLTLHFMSYANIYCFIMDKQHLDEKSTALWNYIRAWISEFYY